MGEGDKGRGERKKRKRGLEGRECAFYLEYDIKVPRWRCELSQKVFWDCMVVAMAIVTDQTVLLLKAIPDTNKSYFLEKTCQYR